MVQAEEARRAITRETISQPGSITDEDLTHLIADLSNEIQLLFPDDDGAGPLAHGLLGLKFRKVYEVPEFLESDQVEDWILGQTVLTIYKTQEHQRRVYEYLGLKLDKLSEVDSH